MDTTAGYLEYCRAALERIAATGGPSIDTQVDELRHGLLRSSRRDDVVRRREVQRTIEVLRQPASHATTHTVSRAVAHDLRRLARVLARIERIGAATADSASVSG